MADTGFYDQVSYRIVYIGWICIAVVTCKLGFIIRQGSYDQCFYHGELMKPWLDLIHEDHLISVFYFLGLNSDQKSTIEWIIMALIDGIKLTGNMANAFCMSTMSMGIK